jgi:Flp pilus assembly pilin Flp
MQAVYEYLLAKQTELAENEEGQTTTEYALVIAAVILIAGTGIALLGGVLDGFFSGIQIG